MGREKRAVLVPGRGMAIGVMLCLAAQPFAWGRFEAVTCRNSYTQQQEISAGEQAALKIYQQMPVLAESDPVSRYVQQLGARLVQSAPLVSGVSSQWPFNFHVVASEDINAFALPGGSIFVNLGTVQAAGTEAQLAGVMAHEISHVVMRHSTCNLGKQRKRSVLYGLGAIGSTILLGNGAAGQLAETGIGFGENVEFLHMSRTDEQQADLLGVGILDDAGYDPRGLPQFFEIIQAKYGAGGAQFLSDHPNPGNRTQYVDQEIATLPPRVKPLVTTTAFSQAHAVAMQEKALSAKDVQAGGWRRSGQYAVAPGVQGVAVNTSGRERSVPVETRDAGAAQRPSQAPSRPGPTAEQLGLGTRMVRFQATQFSVNYPPNWTHTTDPAGVVTFAPRGGLQGSGISYGVVAGVEKESGNGVSDAASVARASEALVQRLLSDDSQMRRSGSLTSMQVAHQFAESIELQGVSPLDGGGGALPERDRVVTVARPDGDLCYLIFVAPAEDYNRLKPLFDAMLASFSPQ